MRDRTRPRPARRESLVPLLREVRSCTLCAAHLPLGPRPVLQADRRARLLIAGQAPGRRVHESGVPFADASGRRLRAWMQIDEATFYDATRVAILPMGFCYPGTGRSGDLPPRPECAEAWRTRLLAVLPAVELTLVVGRYALAWHLGRRAGGPTAASTRSNRPPTLSEAVRDWRGGWPHRLVLPHPSPRNTPWLRQNPVFEREVLPALRARLRELGLAAPSPSAPG